MKKLEVIGLVVVLVLVTGIVQRLGRDARTQQSATAIVENELAQIKEIAIMQYPDMPLEDAMSLVANERSETRMREHSQLNQQVLAAVGFSTFYRANTSARAVHCSEAGVDISPFTSVFQNMHNSELQQTTWIFQASNTDFERDWLELAPFAAAWAQQDLQGIAIHYSTDIAGACQLFAESPDEVAELLTYSSSKPEERRILMSYIRDGI